MGTIGGALRYITALLVCVASFIATAAPQLRHSRESGNPDIARQRNPLALLCNAARCVWIPAFAGMTGVVVLCAAMLRTEAAVTA